MVLDLIKGTFFLCLTGLGIIGNMFIFMNYTCVSESTEKKPTHLILTHLAFTNIIMLLSKGIPKTISAFNLGNFLDDTSCKVFVYLSRLARGLSICTSCLLTVVQAITISPMDSMWRRFNPKTPCHMVYLLLFFWVLNSLISMNLPFSIKTARRLNMSQMSRVDNYCYFVPENRISRWIFLSLMILRDAVFQGVMGGASGYMVFLLHQHHQRFLHLHDSRLLHRTPPELRAAKGVLLLMLCFLFFYWTDCVISIYFTFSLENYSIIVYIPEFLTLGYVIFSPFVLIHRDQHLAECWHAQCKQISRKAY